MTITCHSCGGKVPDQFEFCGFCGELLKQASSSSPLAEPILEERSARRLVTILFADMTNSTRAAESKDPEQIYITIRNTLENLSAPVKRLGGQIDRFTGDGFLATFGVPEAHEDDPTRALLAAIEMQQSMREISAKAEQYLGWDMQLRIGVNVGPVISGQLDTGSGLDWSVYGHTVNLADRLQNSARPGTILVSETVYRHTRAQFNFNSPISLKLKGMDRSIIGYELLNKRPDPQTTRGLFGRHTPNIGRNDEYETLVTNLQRMSLDRHGVIALVSGDAGIGKTRLVDEVVVPLAEQFAIIRVQASPHEAPSYALLSKILEQLAGIEPDDPAPLRRERLNTLLSLSGEMTQKIGSALHDLVSAGISTNNLIREPQQHQRSIFAAVRQLFSWLARRQPILMVLDDIQWADSSSLDALDHIADLINEIPVTLIAIARSTELEGLPKFLLEPKPNILDNFLDIRLLPLSPQESSQLLALLLSELSLPEDLKHVVYNRSNGNPLLIEEMARMLLDEGVIQETSQGWQLNTKWIEVVQSVPETVNGLLLTRYDRLKPRLKNLLDYASVLGTTFPLNILSAMIPLTEAELRGQLNELVQADFIRRTPGTSTPFYFFRHTLMQEAIYETILQEERGQLHLRAARLIQQLSGTFFNDVPAGTYSTDIDTSGTRAGGMHAGGIHAVDNADAAIIGHHLEKAKSPEASKYLLQAAAQAAESFANQEAINFYQRVEVLLSQKEEKTEEAVDLALGMGALLARTGRSEAALEQLKHAKEFSLDSPHHGYCLGEIHYQLGLVHADRGEYQEAITNYEAAVSSPRERVGKYQSFSQTDIERELGWIMCHQGKLDQGRLRAEKALALAQEDEQSGAVGSAHNLLAVIHYWNGQLSASVESARQALKIREDIGDVWGAASSQTTLGVLCHRLGQWSQAESLLRQAIFVQQEIGDYQTLSSSWSNLGLLLLDSGRLDEALQCMNAALDSLPKQEHTPVLASGYHLNRGIVWLRLNEIDQALLDFEKAQLGAKTAKNKDYLAIALIHMAEAHLSKNEVLRAAQLIEQAEGMSETANTPEIHAEAMRVKSYLFEATHDFHTALQANSDAQELYKQIGNEYEIARRQVEAAEYWLKRNGDGIENHVDILRGLEAARETFRKLHAQADIPRAEKILAKARTISDQAKVTTSLRQVLILHINLRMPSPSKQGDQVQEKVANWLKWMAVELKQVGKTSNALLVATKSGFAYVLSSSNPRETDRLVSTAVGCAQSAIDKVLRQNKTSQRQNGIEIQLGIGIAGGKTHEPLIDEEKAAIFANAAQIGRHAEAVAKLAPNYQIYLTGEITGPAQTNYELTPIDAPSNRRIQGSTYRLVCARSESRPPSVLPGSCPDLIGRNIEMTALTGWIDRLRSETAGRICYLEAEAGMGKTRLLEEVLSYAQPDVLCLWGKCESFRSDISYWPLINILDNPEIPETPASLKVKNLLGLRPPDDRDDNLIHNLSAETLRQELFGRVHEFLRLYAREQHILLVIEDIQWLDLSTLDMLDFILTITIQAPVSIMLIARSEIPGPHRALISKIERAYQDRYLGVSFSNLSEGESFDLVRGLLGSKPLPIGLDDLLSPFLGHPLSIEEAVRFLIERNSLFQANGNWHLKDSPKTLGKEMPENYKDLLLARLNILDSEPLHVLQAAAVLGETFDRTVLSRMIPGITLFSRLTELVERGWLLTARPDNPLIFRFRHTLTRETIYATLFRSKKQLLHQRAGEAIERFSSEAQDEYLELVAHHYGNSGLREKSLHYLTRAAEKSAARYALVESLSYFRKAEKNLKSSPHTHPGLLSRVLLGLSDVLINLGKPSSAIEELNSMLQGSYFEPSVETEATCLRLLGAAKQKLGELDSAVESYRAALDGIKIWEQARAEFHTNIDETKEREKLIIKQGIAQTYFDMRMNMYARQQTDDILNNIDRQKYPLQTASALNTLAGIAYREEDFETAHQLTSQCLAIYQQLGNRIRAASAYSNLGLLTAARGDVQTAYDHMNLSLVIHDSMGNAHGTAVTRNNLGHLELNRGNYSAAFQHLKTGSEIAHRADLNHVLSQTLSNLGHVLFLSGRNEEAFEILNKGESLCKNYDFKNMLSEILWKRAEVLITLGELQDAKASAEAARQLAIELDSKDLGSEALRVLARFYRRSGETASAVKHSSDAWQARMDSPYPSVRARFAAEYALSLKADNRFPEAEELLWEHVKDVQLIEPDAIIKEVTEALGDL